MRAQIVAVLGLVGVGALAGAVGAADYLRPYNGKDLTGWHVEQGKLEAWQANGDLISCVKPGGGYLALDDEYGDFELKLEYRLPKAGNSGLGLRFPRGGWPSTDGMELQLLDDDAPQYAKLSAVHRNGSLYTFVGPKVRAGKPFGEWNSITVRCKGPLLTAKLNGQNILDVNLDEHQEVGKGKVPLAQRPRRGLVGLQSHGDPVDFRKIRIREL